VVHSGDGSPEKKTLLITITAGVRGAIHEHSIEKLTRINIPKSSIKKLMKDIHQNAIKYLTYLVLNKRKLDNNKKTLYPLLTKNNLFVLKP